MKTKKKTFTGILDWRTCPECERPHALGIDTQPGARVFKCRYCPYIRTDAVAVGKVVAKGAP